MELETITTHAQQDPRPGGIAGRRAWIARRPAPWRLIALGLLFAAVTLDRYTVTVAGLNVKLEHVAILALWGAVAWGVLRAGWRPALRPLAAILLFLAALFLASLLNAPDRVASLRHTALVAVVASGAWLVYWATDTPARLRAAVRLLIALGIVEAGLAFAALMAGWFWIPFGKQPGRGEILVPYGTLWEPNMLGSYLAAAACLLLPTLLVARRRAAGRLAAGWGLVLGALALSLARGAWLGLAAGLLTIAGALWWAHLRRGARRILPAHNIRLAAAAALAALAFLAVGAPLLFPLTARGLGMRANVAAFNPQTDPSLQVRTTASRQALDGILAHPFLGNGAGSYAADHVGEKGAPGWIANLELHLLYDSGLIGLGALFAGLAWVVWRAGRGLRAPPVAAIDLRPETIGLLGAAAALLVAFQATEGTWLAFTWVYGGLLARAAHLMTGAGPAGAAPSAGVRPGSDSTRDPYASAPALVAGGPGDAGAGHRHTSGRT